jgi:hypothetical protein
MNISSSRPFRKEAACPAANELLTYSCEDLSPNEMGQVRRHLCSCDFCSAELLLLTRHPPKAEDLVTPVMPGHLRLLAKALLTDRRPRAEAFAEVAAYEISA